MDDISFDGVASFELDQRGTRSFSESIEAGIAIRTNYRMAVLVQHHDFLFRDEEVPSASDAVVESSLLAKQRGIAHGPDYKLVPKAGFVLLWAEKVAFPKLHEKALNAFFGPLGQTYGIKGGIEIGSASQPCIMLQNEMLECVLKSSKNAAPLQTVPISPT